MGLPLPQELVLEATTESSAENVGKGKTPADLFELIARTSPIQQTKVFEAARVAGINEKYTRRFLSVLIAEKRILVQEIPREKAKSALGYVRAPSPGDLAPAQR